MGMESGVLQLASERSGDLQYAGRVYGFGTRFGLRFNLLLSAALLGIGCFAPLKIEGGRRLLLALCLMPVCHLFLSVPWRLLFSFGRWAWWRAIT